MSIFKGLSAFAITPCDADGALLADDLRRVLTRIEAADVQSIGLLGSTGLYPYLSRETRRQTVQVARSVITTNTLIVGVGTLRTDEAVQLAQDAAKEGADALLLAPVSYLPLMEDEVFEHFKTVSAATDLPLCIYNNPTTTHFHFSAALLKRLADVPKIDAVKMPLPANMEDVKTLRATLRDDLSIGYSGDWGCPDCTLAGGEAWYSVIAGYLPHETAILARAAEQGDADRVAALNAKFAPLWALFKTWGGMRTVYTAAALEGFSQVVMPRPLLPLPPHVHDDLKDAFASARSVTP